MQSFQTVLNSWSFSRLLQIFDTYTISAVGIIQFSADYDTLLLLLVDKIRKGGHLHDKNTVRPT